MAPARPIGELPEFRAGFEFEPHTEGTCICGVTIAAGYCNGHPTVLHPLPMCETFKRFESPIDFLAYVNNVQRS